jgi:hypothetical protein
MALLIGVPACDEDVHEIIVLSPGDGTKPPDDTNDTDIGSVSYKVYVDNQIIARGSQATPFDSLTFEYACDDTNMTFKSVFVIEFGDDVQPVNDCD